MGDKKVVKSSSLEYGPNNIVLLNREDVLSVGFTKDLGFTLFHIEHLNPDENAVFGMFNVLSVDCGDPLPAVCTSENYIGSVIEPYTQKTKRHFFLLNA